ncbi:unnamed protein product [Symbiodinium pilosum]|uniref:Uncharacterized protein n=1 Tax=Symbiodinium pilosum TaxID=2952 RepID=A0A812SFH4_SYMPI|nr:unnamed protein product [Symbiodinium pilosum]
MKPWSAPKSQEEGLLPTVALVLDRICAYARRQRLWLLGHDWAKEGLGLLMQRGWLKEEPSLFYTCLRCSEVLLRDVVKGLSPRSSAPKAPLAALDAERRALETEAQERHGARRLISLARGATVQDAILPAKP